MEHVIEEGDTVTFKDKYGTISRGECVYVEDGLLEARALVEYNYLDVKEREWISESRLTYIPN